MAMDMRGLSVFISDIRKCAGSREAEQPRIEKELAKIRAKFQKPKELTGYDRKKYVCKLLYIYMLGYQIDFGHMEAINLMSAEKYGEKHIGYLAVAMLLDESHQLLTLVTNSVKQDLNSGREYFQCLALTCIGNVGGKEFAEAMGQDVQKILLARDTKPMVRKKAALCLLRLFRKYPEVFSPDSIVEPVCDIIGGVDFGVAMSVTSLVLGFLSKQENVAAYEPVVGKVIKVLGKIILSKDFTSDYVYYGVPAPWLQIKLFRILLHYPAPTAEAHRTTIQQVLSKIISASARLRSTEKARTPSRNNAVNSVLAEAISLVVHYDNDTELLKNCVQILVRFVNEQKDPNLRYLGLELMGRMTHCSQGEIMESLRKHQGTILNALKELDVSILRRALDLLFAMCDSNSAGEIVGELLVYLTTADFNVREDLVLKIAILAEKFAYDFSWYVDVVLNTITQAGDFVSDDVFHRVVHIISNHENVQTHAADIVFKAVNTTHVHEVTVKVAAYVLGEFGYLISNVPESSASAQVAALVSKIPLVSSATVGIILNALVKFVNWAGAGSPQVKEQIKKVFLEHRSSMDPEVQQRASEYFVMATTVKPDVLQVVLENIPPFDLSSTTSKVAESLQNKAADTTDRNLWLEKEKERRGAQQAASPPQPQHQAPPQPPQQQPPAQQQTIPARRDELDILGLDDLSISPTTTSRQAPPPAAPPPKSGGDLLDDLLGGPVSPPPAAAAAAPAPPKGGLDDLFGDIPTSPAPTSPFGGGVGSPPLSEVAPDDRFWNLAKNDKGVAYEDGNVQVGIKQEFHGNSGKIAIFIGNKSQNALNNVRLDLTAAPGGLHVTVEAPPPPIAQPRQQIQSVVNVMCNGPFDGNPPTVGLSWTGAEKVASFVLSSPVTKFLKALPVSSNDEFLSTWRGIQSTPNPPPNVVFPVSPNVNVDKAEEAILQALHGTSLRAVDNNPNNFVVLTTFSPSNIPVLLNCETNPTAHAIRLTVKSQVAGLSDSVREIAKNILQKLS